MNYILYNSLNKEVDIIDRFDSMIWTDRYSEGGDFELVMDINSNPLILQSMGCFIYSIEEKQHMVIEDFDIRTDSEIGDYIIVSGRSLSSSILDRRIVWNQTNLTGNLQLGIKQLLDENAISPSDPLRVIPNLVFDMSDDTRITSMTIDCQITGENLYNAIKDICIDNYLGFKVIFDGVNLRFSLYMGEDRSFEQDVNPPVIFSPQYNNLINSSYFVSSKNVKNTTLVAGEGEGSDRKTHEVATGEYSGLNRRELFTDARDISSTVFGGNLTEQEYTDKLIGRGSQKLSAHQIVEAFDGRLETLGQFEYGKDYNLGDVVQVVTKHGIEAITQVSELIISMDETGRHVYPGFSNFSL